MRSIAPLIGSNIHPDDADYPVDLQKNSLIGAVDPAIDVPRFPWNDDALATAAKGQLGGVMMWFTPNQQQIADPQIRSEAGRIVADALAMQTWTASSGRSFGSTLDTFNADSTAFAGRYCA